MKTVSLITCLLAVCALFLTSCSDDNPEILSKEKLSGFIQKGPFLNGTTISVSELNSDFSQTGKVFNSQIKDNQGTFELTNLQLTSPFVELKADGFYFNEVTDEISKSQITLSALADVSNINTLNVNVLSTLEKGRVEFLVAGGLSFTDAKKKALDEILAIFSLSKGDMHSSEFLDINKSGDDNAILLAISSILQGFRSEAELSELLANLSADISTDGKLDSEVLRTALISHAKLLNPSKIRENMVKRYTDIGATSQVPDFEKYITEFVEKSTYKAVTLFTFPKTVDGLLNLLNEENLVFPFGMGGPPPSVIPYSCLSVNTIKGLSFKMKIEYVEGGLPSFGYWGYNPASNINWKVTQYDAVTNSQFYEIIESGKSGFIKILFPEGNNLKIRISYYENDNLAPSRTRIITVN